MKLTNDYIRGLVEGRGSFTFSTNNTRKVPAFVIVMHERDKMLLEKVRDHLGLKNKIYVYGPYGNDGANRGKNTRLIVREFGPMKNVIIPFFYKRLVGNKRKQFEEWLEKIGSDPLVPESYKLYYKPYKSGYWDKNLKFLN